MIFYKRDPSGAQAGGPSIRNATSQGQLSHIREPYAGYPGLSHHLTHGGQLSQPVNRDYYESARRGSVITDYRDLPFIPRYPVSMDPMGYSYPQGY